LVQIWDGPVQVQEGFELEPNFVETKNSVKPSKAM
jgi:hypothetical protein